jgi:hypothetical protein
MSQLVKTKRQANFEDFIGFGAFLFSIRSCVNWAFFGMSEPTHTRTR